MFRSAGLGEQKDKRCVNVSGHMMTGGSLSPVHLEVRREEGDFK